MAWSWQSSRSSTCRHLSLSPDAGPGSLAAGMPLTAPGRSGGRGPWGARQEGDGHTQGRSFGLPVLPTVLGGQVTLPLHTKGNRLGAGRGTRSRMHSRTRLGLGVHEIQHLGSLSCTPAPEGPKGPFCSSLWPCPPRPGTAHHRQVPRAPACPGSRQVLVSPAPRTVRVRAGWLSSCPQREGHFCRLSLSPPPPAIPPPRGALKLASQTLSYRADRVRAEPKTDAWNKLVVGWEGGLAARVSGAARLSLAPSSDQKGKTVSLGRHALGSPGPSPAQGRGRERGEACLLSISGPQIGPAYLSPGGGSGLVTTPGAQAPAGREVTMPLCR